MDLQNVITVVLDGHLHLSLKNVLQRINILYRSISDISHYLLISRLLGINVNAVKKAFDSGETVPLNGYTYEILKKLFNSENGQIPLLKSTQSKATQWMMKDSEGAEA